MTTREILKLVKWDDVEKALKYHYPEDQNDYRPVFLQLKSKVFEKVKDNYFLVICIGRIDDEFGADESYHVSLLEDEETWSASFVPWKEIVNIPLSENTLRSNTYAEIVAHIIWEITFYGNEEEMNEKKEELMDRAKKFE